MPAILVIEMEEVLEAKIAWGGVYFARSSKILAFNTKSSFTAYCILIKCGLSYLYGKVYIIQLINVVVESDFGKSILFLFLCHSLFLHFLVAPAGYEFLAFLRRGLVKFDHFDLNASDISCHNADASAHLTSTHNSYAFHLYGGSKKKRDTEKNLLPILL